MCRLLPEHDVDSRRQFRDSYPPLRLSSPRRPAYNLPLPSTLGLEALGLTRVPESPSAFSRHVRVSVRWLWTAPDAWWRLFPVGAPSESAPTLKGCSRQLANFDYYGLKRNLTGCLVLTHNHSQLSRPSWPRIPKDPCPRCLLRGHSRRRIRHTGIQCNHRQVSSLRLQYVASSESPARHCVNNPSATIRNTTAVCRLCRPRRPEPG